MERESPAERTDPLLPVITADLVLPVPPPALDDRRLAGLLAELDAEDLLPDGAPADGAARAARPADEVPRSAAERPRSAAERPRAVANLPAPRPAQRDPRRVPPLVIDAADGDAPPDVADPEGHEPDPALANRYVRRDYRPPAELPAELPADAMGLTGLSRVGGSRVGTVLFTAFFLGIFLLILVEVVVSLLQAA